MSQKFEHLKALLKELFQLDQPDLDFGLYRIMHAKSGEVTQFLERDLLPQVKQAFSLYRTADRVELEKDLARAIEQAQSLGANPETLPKVKELRFKLAKEAVDVDALENEVYDHLYSFFRRYYAEGDFLAKRIYKPGVYAIPYEGEELVLHWANEDQYYIKTSEYLRDYAFRLRSEDAKNPMRVRFKLVDAAEGEHGNVRPTEGKERVFILAKDFIGEENGELSIRFEYRAATLDDWPDDIREGKTKLPVQNDLVDIAVRHVLTKAPDSVNNWITELSKPHITISGEQREYSRLAGHLDRYTKRNTFDYFIHKDLGSFLRRELDFYIKNEIMHLDDVDSSSAPKVEQYLSKVVVIRRIAEKLIRFLAQLEDFHKKLWLKKKFVVETQYCITLDRVPEWLYPEIAANDPQRREWERLFAIDELKGEGPAFYSVPLTVEFLKANPSLVLDTSHFSSSFKANLISAIDNLDDQTNGLLIHSENFQALRLIRSTYRRRIQCIYIDPPYNTAVSAIPYKNDYRHSSWATMMRDKIDAMHPLMTDDGIMFASIDKNERRSLDFAMASVFGDHNKVEELIWVQNTNDSRAKAYSTNHEYVEVYARDLKVVEAKQDIFRETKPGFAEVKALIEELNTDHPLLHTIEKALKKLYATHRVPRPGDERS